MYILVTVSILSVAAMAMAALRMTRRSSAFAWLVAALGILLAWGSILLWQLDLPLRLNPTQWQPVSLFAVSPELFVDSYSWLYALSLLALSAAVIFTFPARVTVLSPIAWAGTLALTVVSVVAVMADNPITVALAWTALDMVEYLNTLRMSDSPSVSERAVVAFALRAFGTGFALWASVVSASVGGPFAFETLPQQAGIFMVLAVGLRLGVLPLHLTFRSDPIMRRGFGTSLRLTAAGTSLVVLSRLPVGLVVDERLTLGLLALIAIAALYAGWKWLTLPDELNARPYWILGMSALSLAAALRGNPQGSAAWGVAMLLFGSISFLYSSKQIWFTHFFAALSFGLLGLPFTLTATGWLGEFPLPFVFWPLFLAAHAMLVAGFIRHLFHAGETPFMELPRWAQAAYPAGLGLLVVTLIVSSVWGWPGALQVGAWIVALVLAGLALLVTLAFLRFRRFLAPAANSVPASTPTRLALLQDGLARVLWALYRWLGQMMGYLSGLLEGDGGLLWTLLLMILLITFLRGN